MQEVGFAAQMSRALRELFSYFKCLANLGGALRLRQAIENPSNITLPTTADRAGVGGAEGEIGTGLAPNFQKVASFTVAEAGPARVRTVSIAAAALVAVVEEIGRRPRG
jgi:hypothetical protein